MNWFDALEISEVYPRVFIGGYAISSGLKHKNLHKITASLNVHTESVSEQSKDVFYMWVPFEDGNPIPQFEFTKCMSWLKFMYENGHTVLISCAAGISRSVTIGASFLHFMGFMEFDEALNHIKKIRSVANPAPHTLLSAKKMLRAWPYDGSIEESEAEQHDQIVKDSFIWMDFIRLAQTHTNPNCPLKLYLLSGNFEDNTPRHLISCNCKEK